MSSRASRPRASRKQRLAAGAVLATTGLLGTYLSAIRPQPTYATPNSGASATGGVTTAALAIPTCADAGTPVTTETDLRNAITSSTDDSVICIDGIISLTADLPTIDDTTVSIVGDDSIADGINGADSHQILTANSTGDDTLIVSNLTLRNGKADNGGIDGGAAINFSGAASSALVIDNSSLTANYAETGRGGAVHVQGEDSTLVIQDSVFDANSTKGELGGAVVIDNGLAGATIENTTFSSNRSLDEGAGAIYAEAPLTIRESTFSDDSATENGGAIVFNGSGIELAVFDSTFTNNESQEAGGAIYMLGSSDLRLSGTTFTYNSASESGGAIQTSNINSVTIQDSHFYKNTSASSGGAIHVYAASRDTEVNIASSSFVTNSAESGNGGALHVRRVRDSTDPLPDLRVVIEDSLLNDNEATNGNGGGLYSNTETTIRSSIISGNRARTVDSFTGRGGGLGLATDDDSILISNSSIVGNSAESTAGGIFVPVPETAGTTFDLLNSTVSDNRSTAGYSAVVAYGGELTAAFDYVTFARNESEDDSSAVALSGAGQINNSLFNNVGVQGDPFNLVTTSGTFDVSHSLFTFDNSLALSAGALTAPTFGFADLADLSDNGGPRVGSSSFQSYLPTALAPDGSIAIGAADPALSPAITTDQVGNNRTNRTVGALNGDGDPTPTPTPTPEPTPTPVPVVPPGAPKNATAIATGESTADISWMPPASSGTFPITSYQATVTPGGQSCLVAAPVLTCTITGLTADTSYTAAVRALSGAGWGPTTTTNAFTPQATASIMITGERATVRGRNGVRVDGATTRLVGAIVQARVKLAGEVAYRSGSLRSVKAEGDFTWQRRTGKKVYVYFTDNDGTRSNRIILPR